MCLNYVGMGIVINTSQYNPLDPLKWLGTSTPQMLNPKFCPFLLWHVTDMLLPDKEPRANEILFGAS